MFFLVFFCKNIEKKTLFQRVGFFSHPFWKNPAYGRQSISRPMRIVAPMPQEGGPLQNQQQKKTFFLRGYFRPLPNKNVQMLDHFFPLLFPKDSESLKILDIRLREVGAKRPLKKTENQRRPKKVKKKTFFRAAI